MHLSLLPEDWKESESESHSVASVIQWHLTLYEDLKQGEKENNCCFEFLPSAKPTLWCFKAHPISSGQPRIFTLLINLLSTD